MERALRANQEVFWLAVATIAIAVLLLALAVLSRS